MRINLSIHACRCRRAQLALTRVLFHLLDVGSRELTAEKERREATASHFLKTGREIPIRGKKTDKRVACKSLVYCCEECLCIIITLC